jgi:hypothetical protein
MTHISYIESANHMAAKQTLWRVAVGRFILGFGEIEWFTFHMLSELPNQSMLESSRSKRFAERLRILTKVAREVDLESGLRERLISALRRAGHLADTRNLVAHNPLFLDLFDDRVGADLQYELSKYGEWQARLTFNELEARCKEVETLVEELYAIGEELDAHRKSKET